jgi:preprotein translocase subunit YajC
MLNFLTTTGADVAGGGQMMSTVIMLVVMVAVFYFMLIRPENKRKKEAEQTRNSIKNGDKVTTIGGIVGTAVEVDHEAKTFVLQTGTEENPSFIKFDKVAIYSSEDPNAPVITEEVYEDEVASDVAEEVEVAEVETEEAQPLEEAPAVEDVPATEDAE